MSGPPRPRKFGAGALIMGCFIASGLVRLADPGGSMAKAAAAIASETAQVSAEASRERGDCALGGDVGALLAAVQSRAMVKMVLKSVASRFRASSLMRPSLERNCSEGSFRLTCDLSCWSVCSMPGSWLFTVSFISRT